MFAPQLLYQAAEQVFSQSSLDDLRRFLRTKPEVRKWLIVADYCVRDSTRPMDCFAFSIVPWDESFLRMQTAIRRDLPRDLKKKKILNPDELRVLRGSDWFHLCFVTDNKPPIFSDGLNDDERRNARTYIKRWLGHFEEKQRAETEIAKVRKLYRKSLANSFDVSLFTSLYLTHFFFAYITLLLRREAHAEMVGWFSDRDAMSDWCDGVLWALTMETFGGFAEANGIDPKKFKIAQGVPEVDPGGKMWFDDLIRQADHLAGVLASWNIPDKSEKYVQIARDVMADNANVVVLRLHIGELRPGELGMQWARVLISRKSS